MTLNVFFFTITIHKRTVDLDEARQNERVNQLYENYKDRQASIHHLF